jgi:hypothetical protein
LMMSFFWKRDIRKEKRERVGEREKEREEELKNTKEHSSLARFTGDIFFTLSDSGREREREREKKRESERHLPIS